MSDLGKLDNQSKFIITKEKLAEMCNACLDEIKKERIHLINLNEVHKRESILEYWDEVNDWRLLPVVRWFLKPIQTYEQAEKMYLNEERSIIWDAPSWIVFDKDAFRYKDELVAKKLLFLAEHAIDYIYATSEDMWSIRLKNG